MHNIKRTCMNNYDVPPMGRWYIYLNYADNSNIMYKYIECLKINFICYL